MGLIYSKVQCEKCHQKFDKLASEIKRYPTRRHFCSRKCYFGARRVHLGRKGHHHVCDQCKNPYEHLIKKNFKHNFCSKKCSLNFTKHRNDFTGKKIGRCIVLEKDKENSHKDIYWLIKCKCKEIFSRRHADIRNGRIYECPNCVFRRSQYYIGGKKFGRLSVQDKWEWWISPTNGKKFRRWFCVCECGNELWIIANSIVRECTVSCGCWMQKNSSRYANETLYPIRHGMTGKNLSPIYNRWITLLAKCYNNKYTSFHNWGGAGYEVCDAWRNNYACFHTWMESQEFEEKLTIEIKEGKKLFSPENSFLEDFKVHANKMRKITLRKTHGIDFNGARFTLKEWSQELNISYPTLRNRYLKCKDMDKCVNGKWNDGTGCRMRRTDISDETIRHLYEDGMTICEIQRHLGFYGVFYRLLKMGINLRPRKYRQAVINETIIKESVNKGLSLEEIYKKCAYKNIRNLKRKMLDIGYEFEGNIIIKNSRQTKKYRKLQLK